MMNWCLGIFHKYELAGYFRHGKTIDMAYQQCVAHYKASKCKRCGKYKVEGPYTLPPYFDNHVSRLEDEILYQLKRKLNEQRSTTILH